MFTAAFWKDALERAIRTGAQAILALWPTTAAVLDGGTNWTLILIGAGLATLFSLLTSMVGSRIGDNPSSPAFTNAEPE